MTRPRRTPLFGRAVERLMRRALRGAFARVDWVGPLPQVPPDASVVLYANHHSFYDGYLLWRVVDELLGRRALTWMAEWHRFPFFAAVGALPFPPDDARTRAATIRRTAQRFAAGPHWGLVYFPEGVLHRAEEGLLPFETALLPRLDTILPHKVWLPVAVYCTWDGGDRPVVRMAAGEAHAALDGGEHARLDALWHSLRTPDAPVTRALLPRRAPTQHRWDFSIAAPFFRRYL